MGHTLFAANSQRLLTAMYVANIPHWREKFGVSIQHEVLSAENFKDGMGGPGLI